MSANPKIEAAGESHLSAQNARRWGTCADDHSSLLPFTLAFNDGDVAVDGQISKTFDSAAGLGPFHLQPVQFGAVANS